ncbi:MAG: flagellar hook assembly protein FlgD [Hyphomicrobiales bacterium]|nr:flagellar hook assembly protein FlgD [Hyphomicrobiales bacterium]
MTAVPPTSGVNGANSANHSAPASSTTGAAATNALSYNDFLTLLMAELKNQDPSQPMDPSAMVSQLATVSQVGQAVQTNTTLASLLTESSLTQAELAVGSSMTSSDGTSSGQVQSVNVSATGAATANLTNGDTIPFADGAVVK